jgi:hypothetical protein
MRYGRDAFHEMPHDLAVKFVASIVAAAVVLDLLWHPGQEVYIDRVTA